MTNQPVSSQEQPLFRYDCAVAAVVEKSSGLYVWLIVKNFKVGSVWQAVCERDGPNVYQNSYVMAPLRSTDEPGSVVIGEVGPALRKSELLGKKFLIDVENLDLIPVEKDGIYLRTAATGRVIFTFSGAYMVVASLKNSINESVPAINPQRKTRRRSSAVNLAISQA